MSSEECLDELNELNEINGCCAAVLECTNSDRFCIHSIVAGSRGNEGFDPPPITDHCCDDAASHGLKQGLLHVARATTPAPRKKSLAESRCHREEEDLSICLHPGSRSTRSRASRSFLAGGVVSSSVIVVHVLEGERRRNTFIYSQSRTSSIPDRTKYYP